ncbi:MAG: sigma-70 family RNA polymerase sigma factor [Betaproteobacteria bacterium]|nr:sigma-70 family RNA polymerase sigma factor [Betaproteobacteria bacterium]
MSAVAGTADRETPAFAQDLSEIRPYLLRYARARLSDLHTAEDVVQDTLLAAVANRSPFQGKSGLRTWLVSILKRKIADVYRLAASRPMGRAGVFEEDFASAEENLFAEADREWREGLSDPREEIERRQLAASLMHAVENLPARQRDLFVLVHMHGYSGSEVAARSGLTQSNLWVMLHRARKVLQAQLQHAYC